MSHRIVLLTGASGTLGVELAAGFRARGYGVVALLHQATTLTTNYRRRLPAKPFTGDAPRPGEIVCIRGDITAERLGLDAAEYLQLLTCTNLIVHCAAITEFGKPAALYEAVNIDGTRQVVNFSLGNPYPIPFLHISTAYVCGRAHGTILEKSTEVAPAFSNDYERSKFAAENLVLSARDAGMPAAIVRPSIIVGRQRTGAIRDFANIYVVLRLLTQGKVRTVPADYGTSIDLVAVDYVADVVFEVAARLRECNGRIYHAIGTAPFTLRDISDVIAEYPAFQLPRLIPPQNFDKSALDRRERQYYDNVIRLYEPYLRGNFAFDDRCARALVRRSGNLTPEAFLRRILNYATRVGYLGRPATTDRLPPGLEPTATSVSLP